jgi:hypothetical protein
MVRQAHRETEGVRAVHGSLRQACPELSRRAQDRLWLTTNGVGPGCSAAKSCMVPFDKPVSEQSRRAQDRLWLTTNGVVGELTTNRWFDRLITNGVVGELTTNRWFDELTTNGVVGELTTNSLRQHGISTGSPRTEFSAQSSLTGNMESHHERTLLSLHCRGHATRSSLRPGCGAGKHPGAGA